jgi:hypothetical protein
MAATDAAEQQRFRNSFSTGRRLGWAGAGALCAALVLAADAAACSCRPPDLRRDLPTADGAVVGEVLERRVEGDEARYVLRVEQAYKGDISNRVEVVTAPDGAACGLEAAVGERLGLLLTREKGEWRSGLCSQVDPADFLALRDVEDNSLPAINWGGYVVGFLVLGVAAFLLVRRRRRYSGLR